MVEYPGFWVSLGMVVAGGLCAIMAIRAIGDRDWLGTIILLGLSAGILGHFFS